MKNVGAVCLSLDKVEKEEGRRKKHLPSLTL
jgi:hypothetical protein